MKWAALALLTVAGPAIAQQSVPFKLVIVIGQGGGTAVVDYPNLTRCQRAADAVEAEWKRRYAEAKAKPMPSNTILVSPAFSSFGFCIPG